jgi:hypothetical protein
MVKPAQAAGDETEASEYAVLGSRRIDGQACAGSK